MTIQKKKRRTWVALFVKALFPRLLFLGHGLLCVYLLVLQEDHTSYWWLTTCLVLLVLEGIFNVIVRGGKEFHWFCPSAFLYCVVLIVTMIFFREKQIQCKMNATPNGSTDCGKLPIVDTISQVFSEMEFRASIIEQTGLLILIIGRWLLPQGSISKEQFCQILLIYIGTAADIVEFSEIYGEDDVPKLKDHMFFVHGVMAVWGISVIQFSLTIALPEEGLKEEEEDEDEFDEYEQISYFRSKLRNKVAPMSYMHYKSLLREGINENNNGGLTNRSGRMSNRTFASQQTFQDRYPIFSVNNNSSYMRSKPAGLEPIESPRNRTVSNPGFTEKRPDRTSVSSLNQRYNTFSISSTSTSSKISMPHGSRTPMNIGSPPTSTRSIKPKTSITSGTDSRKQGITTPTSVRSTRIPRRTSLSKRSPKESVGSKTSRSLQEDRESPDTIKTWDRLLERIPFSKKRKRNAALQRKDSTKEDNSPGIGKKEVKSCFYQYLQLIGILLPVCMQDGPFFIIRFLLIVQYRIITEMIALLVTKNALVIIVQIYRILLMYCSEPVKEDTDGSHPSLRVRAAMDTNQRLSENSSSFRNKRASIAVQALSRMQVRLLGRYNENDTTPPSQALREDNTDIEMG